MASIQIYYKNGNYEEFSPTVLPFGDGYLLQNEFIQSDDIENKGVVWERSYFALTDNKDEKDGTLEQFQIVKPENLPKISNIILNNNIQLYPAPNAEVEEADHVEDDETEFDEP